MVDKNKKRDNVNGLTSYNFVLKSKLFKFRNYLNPQPRIVYGCLTYIVMN